MISGCTATLQRAIPLRPRSLASIAFHLPECRHLSGPGFPRSASPGPLPGPFSPASRNRDYRPLCAPEFLPSCVLPPASFSRLCGGIYPPPRRVSIRTADSTHASPTRRSVFLCSKATAVVKGVSNDQRQKDMDVSTVGCARCGIQYKR